jgi:hypothetical protein
MYFGHRTERNCGKDVEPRRKRPGRRCDRYRNRGWRFPEVRGAGSSARDSGTSLDGNNSARKAAKLSASNTALHTPKKSQPAPNSSLILACDYSGARQLERSARTSRRFDSVRGCVRSPPSQLLLRSGWGVLHVLLHAGFAIGLDFLHLGLLVRSQHLEQLIVDAGLLHREFAFDLCFLHG